MTRIVLVASAFFMVACASLHAAPAPSDAAVANRQVKAKEIRQEAEKACSDALDQERFTYQSLEECVSDMTLKLERPQAK